MYKIALIIKFKIKLSMKIVDDVIGDPLYSYITRK